MFVVSLCEDSHSFNELSSLFCEALLVYERTINGPIFGIQFEFQLRSACILQILVLTSEDEQMLKQRVSRHSSFSGCGKIKHGKRGHCDTSSVEVICAAVMWVCFKITLF